jgi:hypothetical protein
VVSETQPKLKREPGLLNRADPLSARRDHLHARGTHPCLVPFLALSSRFFWCNATEREQFGVRRGVVRAVLSLIGRRWGTLVWMDGVAIFSLRPEVLSEMKARAALGLSA